MNCPNSLTRNRWFTSFLPSTALALCLSASLSQAQFTLSDSGTTATVDPNSSAGMNSWVVDGVNQLNQQWFWYRLGNSGAATPINLIGTTTVSQPMANVLSATFANANYSVRIDYTLTGGATSSDISENITIYNTSTSTLNFNFFQYSHFTLDGNFNGMTATIANDGFGYYKATQTYGTMGVAETVDSPDAQFGEANVTGATGTLAEFASGSFGNLNNNTTSIGDATWALQWDFSIAPGSSVDVLKNKHISVTVVPEPSAFALGALGTAAVILRRRRKTA